MGSFTSGPALDAYLSDLAKRVAALERTRTIPVTNVPPTGSPGDGAMQGDSAADLLYVRLGGAWESTQMGLRTMRGTVAADGSITVGAGFTVSKLGTGDYQITFTTAFSSVPSGVAIVAGTAGTLMAKHPTGTTWTSSVIRIATLNSSTGALTDAAFHFVVAGDA